MLRILTVQSLLYDWATATKNSFFSIGGRYNGAVDKTSSGSIRNVQFYDFAMDATCVSAYNTNGQLTSADTVNLATVTGLEEVVFEDIQLQNNVMNNVATFKALAEVFGVLHELFVDLKMPRTAVLSTVWKSSLGIKGKDRTAQKKVAQDWVVKTYNVKPTQDECDAICIGAHYTKNKVETFDWS